MADRTQARRDFARAVRSTVGRERPAMRDARLDPATLCDGLTTGGTNGTGTLAKFVMGHPALGNIPAGFATAPHWEL